MRQNLKLEKEAASSKNIINNNNFSKTLKEQPNFNYINNKQANIQVINYNPYGTSISVNKPPLQSNYIYNITKKEEENYNYNRTKAKIHIIEEAKIK